MHTNTHPLPSYTFVHVLSVDVRIWIFMFASTYVHIIFFSTCSLMPVLLVFECVSMLFRGLAIRSLVAFMCLLSFFLIFQTEIFSVFYSRTHTCFFNIFNSFPSVRVVHLLILHILWKIGFNMIYLRIANMYYDDCNIQHWHDYIFMLFCRLFVFYDDISLFRHDFFSHILISFLTLSLIFIGRFFLCKKKRNKKMRSIQSLWKVQFEWVK